MVYLEAGSGAWQAHRRAPSVKQGLALPKSVSAGKRGGRSENLLERKLKRLVIAFRGVREREKVQG